MRRKPRPERAAFAPLRVMVVLLGCALGGALVMSPALGKGPAPAFQDSRTPASASANSADFRPSPAVARAELNRILKRREFRGMAGPGWLESVREFVTQWIGDLLKWIFSGLAGHPRASRAVMWGLAIVLTLAFITWLFRALLRGPRQEALDLKGPARIARGWRDWAREALDASGRGDYRDAIRLAYWAGIYRLGELGLWQIDRTRTHREYLRLLDDPQTFKLGASPGVPAQPQADARREALSAVTARFEHTWYGRESASAGDFEFVVRQLERMGCPLPSMPATASS